MGVRIPLLRGQRWKPSVGAVEIDWTHPLARGLFAAFLLQEGVGASTYDVTRQRQEGVFVAGQPWRLAPHGPVIGFTGAEHVRLGHEYDALSQMTCWHRVRGNAASGTSDIQQTCAMREAFGFSWNHTASTFQQAWFVRTDNTYRAAKLTTALAASTWYDLAMTWVSASSFLGYLNGSQEVSATPGTTMSPNAFNLSTLGSGSTTGAAATAWFQGQMSDWIVWNRALSAQELRWLSAEPYAMLRPVTRRTYAFIAPATGFHPAWAASHAHTILGAGVV